MTDLKISIKSSMRKMPKDMKTLLIATTEELAKLNENLQVITQHVEMFGGMEDPGESKMMSINGRMVEAMEDLQQEIQRINDIRILFVQYAQLKINPESIAEALAENSELEPENLSQETSEEEV